MLLDACGGFPGASRPSRGLQGPGAQKNMLNEKCARRIAAKPLGRG